MTYLFHDNGGHLTRKQYVTDGVDHYFEYDCGGLLTFMADATGTSETVYDALGRPTAQSQLTDDWSYYEYDAAGRRTKYTDPNADETTYDYDARGAMTHLEDYAANDYYFEYDAVGRRTVKQLPNGALSYFGYDAASRQTSILNVESDMTPISATYYEWNEDGLPTRQRRRGDYDVDHEYVYDDVPRQIGENIKEPDGTLLHGFQYWYDEAGQRIRKSVYPD